MFRLFNKSRQKLYKWILAVFLGIMAFGMVGVVTPFFSGGGNTQLEANVLATISGHNITTQDLAQEIQSQMRTSRLGYDTHMVPRLAPLMLDNMVLKQALKAEASRLGLVVSNDELAQAIQRIPGLYTNGQFVGMNAYENVIQEQTGVTVAQFEAQMRESILLDKVRSVITDNVSVTPGEVRQEFELRNARAKIDYVTFDPSQYLNDVKATPEATEAYFQKAPARYKVPEQRRVRYVLITPDRIQAQAQVTDAEVKLDYQQHLSDYRVPGRVKVAHILFKTTGKTPAEIAQIQKTAEDVIKQIKAGGSFAELAKKYSEDTTAANGGEYGWIVRNQTVKEFEDAAFTMQPGQVSSLVKTIYGFHIIKVEDKQAAHLETLDEVKESIRQDLGRQKLETARDQLTNRIDTALRANAPKFAETAAKMGLEAKETPLFKFNQAVPDLGKSDTFENLAFDLRQDEVGGPVTVPQGIAIIQAAEIVPEHTPKVDEVRALVEQDYRNDEAKRLADTKAHAFANQAKGGDFTKIAKASGLTVKQSQDFTRQDNVGELIPGLSLSAAFTLAPGRSSDVVSVGTTSVVFRVVSHTPADEAQFAQQQAQVTTELLEEKRDLAFEIYRQNLKDQLQRSGKLRLNANAMKEFLASYERQ